MTRFRPVARRNWHFCGVNNSPGTIYLTKKLTKPAKRVPQWQNVLICMQVKGVLLLSFFLSTFFSFRFSGSRVLGLVTLNIALGAFRPTILPCSPDIESTY